VGGAINQSRLLVARVKHEWGHLWIWNTEETEMNMARPMSNLLTPPGLIRSATYVNGRIGDPIARLNPMPSNMGAYIKTERGTRRLLPEESGRGLGIPKEWKVDPSKITKGLLSRTTTLFHWEYLSSTLSRPAQTAAVLRPEFPDRSGEEVCNQTRRTPSAGGIPFSWKPPDLREGGVWCERRLANLRKAADSFEDPTRVYEEGVQAINTHRGNYTADGPAATYLQLLWWEFPTEHWVPLREGSRMNFLQAPEPMIHDNAAMDIEQTQVAGEFVEELSDLGVVKTPSEGRSIITTSPLFVVPEEGQEGQWRVISDMLRGGQNNCIAGDPVFLPRISHILDQMCSDGYSAVVDASKYFYQFPTHPDNRPYLGLKHPITGVLLEYAGLPMG
jgi:hypothetical protein